MNSTKWFDRRFSFDLGVEDLPDIVSRMGNTAGQLRQLSAGQNEASLTWQPLGKWSVKEHVGHLLVLEPLWQQRLQDIDRNEPVLTAADLDNKATTAAGFNNDDLEELIAAFSAERQATLDIMDRMDMLDFSRSSAHPRLQQVFRFIDHAYFIAEHDDHHLAVIREILEAA